MKKPQNIYLKDYQPPSFLVDHVSLRFKLNPTSTQIVSTVKYRQNPNVAKNSTLELDGFGMLLHSIKLNGNKLPAQAYQLHKTGLTIPNVPDAFELEICTMINPENNTALEGLYRSSGNYCTQCEAQGFRRITYYQDRPDVMAPFAVHITADKETTPILLSNGNPTASGKLEGGLHWAEWVDPYAKPCYLFALVAGDLSCVEDVFTTTSGREIALKIYTEAHHINHCAHAMASLKRAMAWDEKRFGLEYDLNLFMIVAVDDFNMGAMENKGLNIFNSRLVFASPETATDDDYIAIEAVIGHEYFHNWTGNRVTCRDWFQLSLKEGLTVFRDQEFTADMHSRAVKRIEDVRLLRSHQFAEDASPMAHPIRPSSYMEINNFYTVTVYEKGAEVVRLYQSLVGTDGFRDGMDLYFERHDGQAVCTEDFLAAMADANQINLSQMQNWYEQAGTPTLSIRMEYDDEALTCTLHCKQSCSNPTSDSESKPFLIPLTLALVLPDGTEQALQLETEAEAKGSERTLLIKDLEQSFTFIKVKQRPLPSLLRGFSAPVELNFPYTSADNAFLMKHDSDSFNRWAAAQRLIMQSLLDTLNHETSHDSHIIPALAHLLHDQSLDHALKAEALMLPSEADIAEQCRLANPIRIHTVRKQLASLIASELKDDLTLVYQKLNATDALGDQAMQQRKLKNVCLNYLVLLNDKPSVSLAYHQFKEAENMTDQYAALAALANCDCKKRLPALHSFEKQWRHDSNVMDKWFFVQATSSLPDTLATIKTLMTHENFDITNPNKIRALLNSFALRNPLCFHALDGSGYQFIANQVLFLDKLNPQVAARLVRSFMNWKRLEEDFSAAMRSQLQRIADTEGLSNDVYEIVCKSLAP